jgi:translation elongation factor EF-G
VVWADGVLRLPSATDLRSLTQGRSTFMLEFLRYDIVPETLSGEIIARRRAEGKIPER